MGQASSSSGSASVQQAAADSSRRQQRIIGVRRLSRQLLVNTARPAPLQSNGQQAEQRNDQQTEAEALTSRPKRFSLFRPSSGYFMESNGSTRRPSFLKRVSRSKAGSEVREERIQADAPRPDFNAEETATDVDDPLAEERQRAISMIQTILPEIHREISDVREESVPNTETLMPGRETDQPVESPVDMQPIKEIPTGLPAESHAGVSFHCHDLAAPDTEENETPNEPNSLAPVFERVNHEPPHITLPEAIHLPTYLGQSAATPSFNEPTPEPSPDPPASESDVPTPLPAPSQTSEGQGPALRRIMVQGLISTSSPLPQTNATESATADIGPNEPPSARPSSPATQAVLIARLLSVAAAASAASLFPAGAIVVGGQTVPPFPGMSSATTPQTSENGNIPQAPSWFDSLPLGERETPTGVQPTESPARGGRFSNFLRRRRAQSESAADGQIIISRPSLVEQPFPDNGAAEGSFERFLSDLQTDVGVALLREHQSTSVSDESESEASPGEQGTTQNSQNETEQTSETDNSNASPTPETSSASSGFSFFRSYRFADRQIDGSGNTVQSSPILPESADLSPPVTMPGSFTPPSPVVEAESTPTTSERTVAPLILVGVRRVGLANDTEQDRVLSSLLNMDAGTPSDSRSPLQEGEDSTPLSVQPTGDASTPINTPPSGPTSQTSDARQWMIWIAAGIYETSHPIFAIPLLLANLENMSYEDMLRLAAMIGQAKAQTVTKSDLDSAQLPIIHRHEIQEYLKDSKVLANTVERCLVCLMDYEDDEEIRVLNCRHAFHRECVDRWLETSRNSCPCCRAEAVSRKTHERERSSLPTVTDSPITA